MQKNLMKDKVRAGPAGVRDYSTRMHGDIKYNRRKEKEEAEREIEMGKLEKSVKDYYKIS